MPCLQQQKHKNKIGLIDCLKFIHQPHIKNSQLWQEIQGLPFPF